MSKKKKAAPSSPAGKQQSSKTKSSSTGSAKVKYAPMKRSTKITFAIIMVIMVFIFVWKWLEVIRDGYFDAFIVRGENTEDAVSGMTGLSLSSDEAATLLSYQLDWDSYCSSRLRDEVSITNELDGTLLHAYYYDQGSELTVVVIHQFDGDGTDDFLAGAQLYQDYGCNLLLIDQRAHGQSGGDYFSYGYYEQTDLACWLDWARQELHTGSFILWGEGTGANTILFAAASGYLRDDVLCIVAESPYASLHELATRNIWKFYSVPAVPFLTAIEYKLENSDAGFTVEDLELAQALSADAFYPAAIFLESAGDEYILTQWTEAVYDAYQGEKSLISGGGTHGTVYAYCAEELHDQLSALLGD